MECIATDWVAVAANVMGPISMAVIVWGILWCIR